MLGCAAFVIAFARWQPSGDSDAWLLDGDRLPRDLAWVELRIADGEPADEQRLADAAEQVGELLGPRRVAIAPPLHALASWLDARGWWLVDPTRHEELAARFEPEAVDTAVGDLRAELSSPFAMLDVEARRRDPLDVRGAWLPLGGRIGDDVPNVGVRASDRGDWLAADGRGVLIAVRSSDQASAWLPAIEKEALRLGLIVSHTDVASRDGQAAMELSTTLGRFTLFALTGLALTLALGVRSASLTGLVLLAVSAGLVVHIAFAGPWSPSTTPIAVALLAAMASLAAGIDATVEEQRWSVLAMSVPWLAALAAPWPALRDAALPGLLATAVANFPIRWACTRAAAPAASTRTREWGGARRLVLGSVLLLPGLVGLTHATLRGPRDGQTVTRSARDPFATLAERYVDLERRAWIEDRGKDEAEALANASSTAQQLAALKEPTGIDAVGIVVLADDVLPERRKALGVLNLRGRVERVASALEAAGLRAEAFGEFVDNLDQLTRPPSASEALASPLAPWLRHAMHTKAEETVVHTSLHVSPDLVLPEIVRADGKLAVWRGPAAAARRDAERLLENVVVILAGVAWAVAFAVWMVTRRFDVAMVSTAIGVSALGFGASAVVWQGSPLSPLLAPAAMIVVATVVTSTARVSLVLIEGQPRAASTLLLGTIAPAIVGAAAIVGLPEAGDVGLFLLAGCGGGVFLLLLVPPIMLAAARSPIDASTVTMEPVGERPEGPEGVSSPASSPKREPRTETATDDSPAEGGP